MNVIILEQALEELKDALDYYEDQQLGLGVKLKDEIFRHVNWIRQNPEVPRERKGNYRRVNLKIFPYYLAYTIKNNTLWILAVAHSFRKPEYWIQRRDGVK